MFKRKCKITFIAHGATINNLEGIISSSEKYPKINDIGEEEIEKVCEFLKHREVQYTKIYTSKSTKCSQTAQIIANLFKQKPIPINLPARNCGEWEGQVFADVFKESGAKLFVTTPKNGEPIKIFNQRVKDCLWKLIDNNRGDRVIVVTTPDVIQSAVAQTLELNPEAQFKILIKTGSLTQISYFEDNWSSIIYSNYVPM